MLFRRRRTGQIRVRLLQRDRRLIAQLPDVVDSATDSDDPGYEVINRAAYPEDASESLAFASLVGDEVERRRRGDRIVAEAIGGGATEIDDHEARALLRVINEGRLVLAARAGAFDEGAGWEQRIRRDPALATVAWLGYVQSKLVDALMGR